MPVCQRWRDHRSQYRPSGEVINIDEDGYFAEKIPFDLAKKFVDKHHYSKSYVATQLQVGLWRDNEWGMHELCGVAAFSVPMSQRVIPKWLGCEPHEGTDLGRFVLLDDVPGNGESWFLGKAFAILEAELPEKRAVMATSDPVMRKNIMGILQMPGHVGTIYQAHNGAWLGRTTKKTLHAGPTGNVLTARTISKVRNRESGKDYAYEKLLNAGAPEKNEDEDWREYTAKALQHLTKFRHPGNHVYSWALGNKKQKRETRQMIGNANLEVFPTGKALKNPSRYPKLVESY